MNSPTSIKTSASVRRGPTLRGGRHRAGAGRSTRVPPSPRRSASTNNQEEETIGLTAQESTFFDEDVEKYPYEDEYPEASNGSLSEKVETDDNGKPIYNHGDETFGDILTHPIEELNAHHHRKEEFQTRVGRWSLIQQSNKNLGEGNNSNR